MLVFVLNSEWGYTDGRSISHSKMRDFNFKQWVTSHNMLWQSLLHIFFYPTKIHIIGKYKWLKNILQSFFLWNVVLHINSTQPTGIITISCAIHALLSSPHSIQPKPVHKFSNMQNFAALFSPMLYKQCKKNLIILSLWYWISLILFLLYY